MKKPLIIALLIFNITSGYAQIDSSGQLKSGVIQYTKSGFWIRKINYTIGGRPASGKEIITKLLSYQPSAKEDNSAAKYNTLAWCVAGGALSCLAATLIINDSQNSYHTRSSKIFLGVGIGLIIPEAIFTGKRNKHFKNSLELYNQQFH